MDCGQINLERSYLHVLLSKSYAYHRPYDQSQESRLSLHNLRVQVQASIAKIEPANI